MKGSGTTLALAVGLCALVSTAAVVSTRYAPNTWIQRDGRFYTNVNVTLAEGLSVDQGEFCASWYEGDLGWNRNLDQGWSNVARGADGEHLPKHPILLPLLSTPLFWAFGLHGTLIFNVLVFGLIALGTFAFARRYASVPAAAFAALALPLAIGVRGHAYDYHVDPLILALFVCGVALMHARRGFWAGVLIGATVVLRPTSLLWVPALACVLAAKRDWRTLRFALLGGAIPLVLFALSNAWLYGMPWWTGYNRVLVVVNGEAQLADHNDAFSVPLREGLRNLWSGPWGVRQHLTLMAAAGPGLLLLLRRKPTYALSTVVTVIASVLLFATYRWYGHRFLWLSCGLLIPALAVTFDTCGRAVRKRPWWRSPVVAALAASAILILHSAFPLEAHFTAGTLDALVAPIALFAALAFGLTQTAARAGASRLAIVAPLTLILLPGAREAVLAGGANLVIAAAVCLALGARHWLPAILFALAAAVFGALAYGGTDLPALFAQLGQPAGRPTAILLAIAVCALPILGRRALLLLPLALLASPRIAGLGGDRWPLFALALLCVPVPLLMTAIARAAVNSWRSATRPQRVFALAAVPVGLLAAGLAPRLSPAPFRIASYQGVRSAEVHLGDVPCDFLAWEHLNWECATFDRGVHGQTGLATSQPLHVAGEEAALFVITTQRGRSRTVRWDAIRATDTLKIRWAVPDEKRGGGSLVIRIDGEELASIILSRRPDGRIHQAELDTRRYAGRDVTLELELRLPGDGVLVDGAFE